jgi:predicted ATP-grasp superfamily ATP-dependent carboligase
LGQPAMSKEPNIIVIGASARAAAFSALRAGMRPYAIDLFADSDLVDVCPAVKIKRYPQDFEQALAESPQAPWIYTGGLENYPDLVEGMAALRPLYGNRADVLRKVRDPELLAACLAGNEAFRVPEIRSTAPAVGSGKEWLRKPRRSSAGLGIRRADLERKREHEEHHYYQEFVPGPCRSAIYLARSGDCELLGVTEQNSGAPEIPEEPFLYAGSDVSSPIDWDDDILCDLGRKLTQSFGLRGLFNADFADYYSLLEINPRYSASVEVLEHCQGKNFLAMHVAEFDAEYAGPIKCWISKGTYSIAKRVVYAACDCVVTPELERLRRSWNAERLLPCLADIPRAGEIIRRGQPVVTVIAEGPGVEIQRLLNSRVEAVKQALSPT